MATLIHRVSNANTVHIVSVWNGARKLYESRAWGTAFNALQDARAWAQGQNVDIKPRAFINRQGQGIRETVDEFDTLREARNTLHEYRMSDPSGRYWISSRCCRDWKDRD